MNTRKITGAALVIAVCGGVFALQAAAYGWKLALVLNLVVIGVAAAGTLGILLLLDEDE